MNSIATFSISSIWIAITAIFPFILVFYAWSRAGSAHFLIDRIWLLVGGKRDIADNRLRELWTEARELEGFRFRTGIALSSKLDLDRVLLFVERNKLSLLGLMRVRGYFDLQKLEIRKPARFERPGRLTFQVQHPTM